MPGRGNLSGVRETYGKMDQKYSCVQPSTSYNMSGSAARKILLAALMLYCFSVRALSSIEPEENSRMDSLFGIRDMVVVGTVLRCDSAGPRVNDTDALRLSIAPLICFSRVYVSPDSVTWQKPSFSMRNTTIYFDAKENRVMTVVYKAKWNSLYRVFQRGETCVFFFKINPEKTGGEFVLAGDVPRLISPHWWKNYFPRSVIPFPADSMKMYTDAVTRLAEKHRWKGWQYVCEESVDRFSRTLVLRQRLFDPFTQQNYVTTTSICKISAGCAGPLAERFSAPCFTLYPLQTTIVRYDSTFKEKYRLVKKVIK